MQDSGRGNGAGPFCTSSRCDLQLTSTHLSGVSGTLATNCSKSKSQAPSGARASRGSLFVHLSHFCPSQKLWPISCKNRCACDISLPLMGAAQIALGACMAKRQEVRERGRSKKPLLVYLHIYSHTNMGPEKESFLFSSNSPCSREVGGRLGE